MKQIFMVFFLLLSFSAQSASTKSGVKRTGKGWRESYGGDSTIAEFKLKAADVFYHMKKDQYLNLSYDEILKTIDDLKIECRENLILDGETKQAINYPGLSPQLLHLDCEVWNLELTEKQKTMLVIHEFLPLLGFEDIQYENSRLIFNKYTEFKKSYHSSSLDGQSKKTLEFELFLSVMDCKTEKYFKLVEGGADVFNHKSKDEGNLLIMSILQGCADIALDLMNYKLDIKAATKRMPMVFYIALDFQEKLFSQAEKEKLLRKLKNKYPQEFKATVNPEKLDMSDEFLLSGFWGMSSCYGKSNPIHFLAKGIRAMDLDLDSEKIYVEKISKLLVGSGTDLNQVNRCGETPAKLLRKRGIKI